jgi:hypothetical protein
MMPEQRYSASLLYCSYHYYEGTAIYENRTYGGMRGRKTKIERKLLRFSPIRFPVNLNKNET